MIRRHDITYTTLRIEAMRVSTEVFDDDAAPGGPQHRSPRRRPGRNANARSAPTDMPTLARRDVLDRTTDWRDGP